MVLDDMVAPDVPDSADVAADIDLTPCDATVPPSDVERPDIVSPPDGLSGPQCESHWRSGDACTDIGLWCNWPDPRGGTQDCGCWPRGPSCQPMWECQFIIVGPARPPELGA